MNNMFATHLSKEETLDVTVVAYGSKYILTSVFLLFKRESEFFQLEKIYQHST